MKWITHQTAGVGAALALHLPLEGVVAACLGAILPDKLDQAIAKRSRNPQRTFNQIHRGTTHWFGWWVAILLLACSHLVPPHWQPALLGIGLGCLVASGIGSVLGGTLAQSMGGGITFSATPTPMAVAVSFGVSVGIGILFGYLPAKKAAALNPIDALRYE